MSEARATGRPQGRVGTVVNGKWTIDARLGSGGMATVYAATHRNGHRAALKMLHGVLSRDVDTRGRFLREGYVANAVGHPCVVRVEDDGVSEDGCAFLVLELLEGETVEARRTRLGGMLGVDAALDMADRALDALAAAHEKGITHRDVKPDNVFLTTKGEVKLLDFGLARMKAMQAEVTKTGMTIGTPEFMAPEQAQGRRDDVDALSDIWSLGATVFTAITGKYVHDAENLHAQLIACATMRARPIRDLAPHVPASVAIVIDRALELDRKDRWESARAMQRALRGARAPRPDSGPRVPDSLTMPAASLESIRRGAAAVAIPESGPRASTRGIIIPSSGPTLQAIQAGAPISDPTIEEALPMHLDDLPVSSGPMSPVPHTERLRGGVSLQAQSKAAQQVAAALRPSGRHDATLRSEDSSRPPASPTMPSAAGLIGAGHPTGPQISIISASALRSTAPMPGKLQSSGSFPTTLESSGDFPTLGSRTSSAPMTEGSGVVSIVALPSHDNGPASVLGPVSMKIRRASRRVVAISVVLILLCAAAGAWVLLHPHLLGVFRHG